MTLNVDSEFLKICENIIAENKSENEWALIESDDQFQSSNFEGGFDATEMEFCFSFYNQNGQEYWFQLTLTEVTNIIDGKITNLNLRRPE